MVKVGILNVTGYAGVELARIIANHSEAELVSVTGRSETGKKLAEVFPHLSQYNMTIESEITKSVDVVFSALPHKASAEACQYYYEQGVKVVDISADFRLKDLSVYESWYDVVHPCPQYIEDAVYGLPELHKSQIQNANLIANPGCYPTSAILALAPAIWAGIIENDIIVDSKSGISGAGRGLSLGTHFSEVNESVHAYSIDGHRHLPEITQELSLLNNLVNPSITFVPHLIPMTRGILSTCYVSLKPSALPATNAKDYLMEIYNDFYKNEPFTKVVNYSPRTKYTLGNNVCFIYPWIDERTNRLISVGCLDNLVKGAAGQAIQNMNLMFDLPEELGIETLAVYP
jgi:N-acetyl-gamma-glutamyl-phosphate reductase